LQQRYTVYESTLKRLQTIERTEKLEQNKKVAAVAGALGPHLFESWSKAPKEVKTAVLNQSIELLGSDSNDLPKELQRVSFDTFRK